MHIRLITAQVTRDAMTRLNPTVCAHELSVLHTVFGEDNVQVLSEEAGSVELDPAAEGERLAGKYGDAAIRQVFGENYKGAVARACSEYEVSAKAKAKALATA